MAVQFACVVGRWWWQAGRGDELQVSRIIHGSNTRRSLVAGPRGVALALSSRNLRPERHSWLLCHASHNRARRWRAEGGRLVQSWAAWIVAPRVLAAAAAEAAEAAAMSGSRRSGNHTDNKLSVSQPLTLDRCGGGRAGGNRHGDGGGIQNLERGRKHPATGVT